MDFNFYLNSSLPIMILLLSIVKPTFLHNKNSLKSPLILKIFFGSLIVLSLFKTTSISDYPFVLNELSGRGDEISKFPLLLIFINLPFSSELKLILISLVASFILSLSIYNYQKFYKFNNVNFAILIYAIHSLMTFHYRQYLSFSFLVAYIVLIQIPSRKTISKLIIILLAIAIIFTHPIYILPLTFIPLYYSFAKSSFYETFCRDLILKFRNIRLIKVNRIIIFLILVPLLASILIVPLYKFLLTSVFSSYSMYSTNWFDSGIKNSSSLNTLILRSFIFVPFYLSLSNKLFINRFDFKNNLEYRYSVLNVYTCFLIMLLIYTIQNSTGLYAIERTYSVIYPFLIFDPFINKDNKASNNTIFSKLYVLYIISLLLYKTLVYVSSYTPNNCYC